MSVEVAILPAREQSLPAINALIARSKGHWSWPAGYLEQALVLLTIDVDYLRTHQSFEDSGGRVPSRVPGGPLFSVYRLRLRVGTILLALVSSALLLGCVTQPKRAV